MVPVGEAEDVIQETGAGSLSDCVSAQNGGYVPIRDWANRYEVCASNIISSCHIESVVKLTRAGL